VEDSNSLVPQTSGLFLRPKKVRSALINITQELYRHNYELTQSNKTLTLIQKIDEIALESHDSLDVFCTSLSSIIVGTAGYNLAEILIQPTDQDVTINAHGLTTNKPISDATRVILSQINIDVNSDFHKNIVKSKIMPIRQLFDNSIGLLSNFNFTDKLVESIIESLPIESALLVKLTAREKQVGLMMIGFPQPADKVYVSDIQLIGRLSEAVGVAVDNKLLFEENGLIVNELQRTNNKLKELDKIKDDFISIASHQLRTPLTAINGYVSMLMEGMGGKLSDDQKELLSRALSSSKFMSVMISDLLNISRIQSGKFFIDSQPDNLANVAESSVKELTRSAESAGVIINYTKPADFPGSSFDVSKTTNVVMNFIDNAIHYARKNGQIKVEVNHGENYVEIEVIDDGIGVPPSEQKNLFTKFFRANNAKKVSPDGTGIGLYLAREVVAAQKGTLIFASEEGKGSTFGFRLPLKVPSTPTTEETKQ
jgi:signal transduction histidine kinase